MKKWLLLSGLFALFNSQNAAGQPGRAEAEKGKCLVWRISGNGLAQPSYLFATMDFICAGDYVWPKAADEYYKASNKVCLQVNFNDPAIKSRSATAFQNTGGKTLKDYFKQEEYARVERYAKDNLHVDLERVQQYQPVAIRSLIVKKLLGCADPVSYQLRIAAMAARDGKETTGLETIDDEVATIEETHYNDKVAKVLVQMAGGSQEFERYRKNVEDAYQRHDLPAVLAASKESTLFTPADIKVFYENPAGRMVIQMPSLMRQGPVFFALNAVHFWGDKGIISLLKKKGYTVEPVL